jgi:hypothetical protein
LPYEFLHLPLCAWLGRRINEAESFKLSVQVVAASLGGAAVRRVECNFVGCFEVEYMLFACVFGLHLFLFCMCWCIYIYVCMYIYILDSHGELTICT